MRRGCGGERAPTTPYHHPPPTARHHAIATGHPQGPQPRAGAGETLFPLTPSPISLENRGRFNSKLWRGWDPQGSPCETHPLSGKCKGEFLVGFIFFWRKTWQSHPRRGFEDVFLPTARRLGQSSVPQGATTRPTMVLAQLPAWRGTTSASPAAAWGSRFSGTNQSGVVGVLQVITFFNLGKEKENRDA